MLIRNAEINFGTRADVRIADGRVTEVGDIGPGPADETAIDAGGAALLPGLHDHHFHLLAYAASLESLRCGPPSITSEEELANALRARQSARPGPWIRGFGYHHSVAGDIDRHWLDRILPSTPVRIQHRGGRLWILNSCALDLVASGDSASPLENIGGRFTGRLYDGDEWLRNRIGSRTPPIRQASEFLLSRGVTGITDTTPSNGTSEFALLQQARADGDLVQDMLVMGNATLDTITDNPGLRVGAIKIHLREAALPTLANVAAEILRSHHAGRPVAVHCVTRAELIFALGALDEAGAITGDRIEHAAVAPPEILPLLAERRLTVVTQPNFVSERGDAYLRDVDAADRLWLYRLRAFLTAGVPLAGGTDAPFGNADPWRAMEAAVRRRTSGGAVLGAEEALMPEEALALFTGEPNNPGGQPRIVRAGIPADLCLIDRPWTEAKTDFSKVRVVKTIKTGRVVWSYQSDRASTSPH